MTFQWLPTALVIIFGFVGAGNIILGAVFIFGRWTQKVEMAKLSWDIAQVITEVKELRAMIDGRYTALEQRQNADHTLIRQLLTWKAELMVERTLRAKQSEEARAELRAELEALKARIGQRRERDT